MAIRDWFKRGAVVEAPHTPRSNTVEFVVGAKNEEGRKDVTAFDNKNITYQGELVGFDYDSILRNKQDNIQNIFKLADYYYDADPIVHGIIAHVFVPFCSNSSWYLTGAKDKTVKIFEKYYEDIRLREKISDIMLQLAKYGNCYVYLLNGNIITLPIHKVKIGNTTLNGQPILEYDCQSIINEWKQKGYSVKEGWVKDSDVQKALAGFPPEIKKAISNGFQYAQLDPKNTFALQMPKEGWLRYAIPFIVTALPALARKELIKSYEEAMLNLGSKSFVHIRYGDEKSGYDILPDRDQLTAVYQIFKNAMNKTSLAVTNQLAKAEVISADMSDLYQWPIYSTVNEEILSAGGISGIIVNGVSNEGSTFSTAQVSMQTAESRINAMRREFEDMMNRINERAVEFIDGTYNLKEIPKFHFEPLSMTGEKALRDSAQALWASGVVSTKTLLDKMGFSLDIEKAQREKEAADKTDDVMTDRATQHADKQAEKAATTSNNTQNTTTSINTTGLKNKGGRPVKDDSERTSSPDSAARSSQPKPSSPQGSGANAI